MIENIRKENGQILLLDSGGRFSSNDYDFSLSAKYLVRGMDQMGYAAMNLGGSELYAGVDFLREVTAGAGFPLISSNLVYKDEQTPFWKPYMIADVEGVKVGIVGVMPADGLKNAADPKLLENLDVLPPQAALETLVPAVRREADLVILLSQCKLEETTSLVASVKGIDFAICPSGRLAGCDDHGGPQQIETDMLHPARYGVALGFLQVNTDADGQAQAVATKMIPLNKSVPTERLVGEMFNEIKKLAGETGIRAKQAQARAKAALQLSPEEFIKQMQKERPEAVLITK